MSSAFDKLNLRPSERRFVVASGMVIFIIIQIWLVRPKFGEWRVFRDRLAAAQDTISRMAGETNNIPALEKALDELRKEGVELESEDQQLTLAQTVSSIAANASLFVQSQVGLPNTGSKPDPFFNEAGVVLRFQCSENQMVDFLVKIYEKPTYRIQAMDLKPDPSGRVFIGSVTVVGKFLKNNVGAAKPAAQ